MEQDCVNSRAFSPEEVEQGLLADLLEYLLRHNVKSDRKYYDIHLTTDGHCQVVEWATRPYDSEWDGGGFRYVDSEHVVLKEVLFPDNHSEFLFDDEEEEALEEFLKEHPGEYERDEFGTWRESAREVPPHDAGGVQDGD